MGKACGHVFRLIKSDTSLVCWTCQKCRAGPAWMTFSCVLCNLHLCRGCVSAASC
ncbi:hypothetical protein B0J13DRAFT_461486 [Dactylonectria estremocensis]|uniref:Uncharacterized protein n=1 Tax=Dactylonectria estremocensis TaxID=1079267 RepID=A0A9P9I8S9_9HYPO|nr:hypothetical protein B0J13DRAFT_461486 [Dactylonectria estremocensis]